MPQKLSEVGRRHAHARASRGAHDPSATPAERILSGQHSPDLPDEGRFTRTGKTPFATAEHAEPGDPDTEPPKPTMPPPLPPAAHAVEMAKLKTTLAEAQRSLHQTERELDVVSAAQARARDQRLALRVEVDAAQAVCATAASTPDPG